MRNKNIYNENGKIPAAWQKVRVRGSISVTARLHTRAARRNVGSLQSRKELPVMEERS
jgi:hypothetical protein